LGWRGEKPKILVDDEATDHARAVLGAEGYAVIEADGTEAVDAVKEASTSSSWTSV
jgi:hypothetical protein